MKRIMCYGDSNTWGHNPDPTLTQGTRYPEHVRWTGVMQDLLGPEYRVLEEGMGGRTTVFEDPTAYGRNGYPYLEIALRTCTPLDCVIFMLGTNDLKDMFNASAHMITCGMERLLCQCEDILPRAQSGGARILLAAPLIVTADGTGNHWYDFSPESEKKGAQLRSLYADLAERHGCAFFDVNTVAGTSPADGVHLTAEGHRLLGAAMAEQVRQLLEA